LNTQGRERLTQRRLDRNASGRRLVSGDEHVRKATSLRPLTGRKSADHSPSSNGGIERDELCAMKADLEQQLAFSRWETEQAKQHILAVQARCEILEKELLDRPPRDGTTLFHSDERDSLLEQLAVAEREARDARQLESEAARLRLSSAATEANQVRVLEVNLAALLASAAEGEKELVEANRHIQYSNSKLTTLEEVTDAAAASKEECKSLQEECQSLTKEVVDVRCALSQSEASVSLAESEVRDAVEVAADAAEERFLRQRDAFTEKLIAERQEHRLQVFDERARLRGQAEARETLEFRRCEFAQVAAQSAEEQLRLLTQTMLAQESAHEQLEKKCQQFQQEASVAEESCSFMLEQMANQHCRALEKECQISQRRECLCEALQEEMRQAEFKQINETELQAEFKQVKETELQESGDGLQEKIAALQDNVAVLKEHLLNGDARYSRSLSETHIPQLRTPDKSGRSSERERDHTTHCLNGSKSMSALQGLADGWHETLSDEPALGDAGCELVSGALTWNLEDKTPCSPKDQTKGATTQKSDVRLGLSRRIIAPADKCPQNLSASYHNFGCSLTPSTEASLHSPFSRTQSLQSQSPLASPLQSPVRLSRSPMRSVQPHFSLLTTMTPAGSPQRSFRSPSFEADPLGQEPRWHPSAVPARSFPDVHDQRDRDVARGPVRRSATCTHSLAPCVEQAKVPHPISRMQSLCFPAPRGARE